MEKLVYLCFFVVALLYYFFRQMMKESEGTDTMKKIVLMRKGAIFI